VKRLLRYLTRAFVGLGLLVGAGLAALLICDATGVFHSQLEKELLALIEDEPDLDITVRNLEIDWFGPGITLTGLHIVGADGEAFIERLQCHFDLSKDAASPLSAVSIDRGRLLLEREFVEACARSVAQVEQKLRERFGVSELDPLDETEVPAKPLAIPTLTLRDVDIALQLVDGQLVELGKGQARLELNTDKDLTLVGSIALPQEGASPLPLFARVTLTADDRLEVRAAARNLGVSGRTSPLRALFPPALQDLDAHMKLSTDFEMTLSPTGGLPPRARAHVRIEEGYLRPTTSLPPLENVSIVSDFTWLPRETPSANSDLNELWQTLTVRAEVTANVLGETMVGAARLTRSGALEAELAAKNVAIDERFLIEAGLAPDAPIRKTWTALGIGGQADVSLGLRMPLTGDFDPKRDLDIAVDVQSDRKGKFCFSGWDWDGDGPLEREGIPLPCDLVSGHVVFAHRGKNARSELLGIFDASGSHGTGMATAEGMVASPATERMGSDMDIKINVERRQLDSELGTVFEYMAGTRDLYSTYGIDGGWASAEFHLRDRADQGGFSAAGRIHVEEAPLRWQGLPVAAFVDEFDMELAWGAYPRKRQNGQEQRDLGIHFVATGETSSVKDLRIEGSFRDVNMGSLPRALPTQPRIFEGFPVPGSEQPITRTGNVHSLSVSGSGLGLRGADWDVLVDSIPGLGERAEELDAKGKVAFQWTEHARVVDGAREVALEVTPEVVELLPRDFPMVTRKVEGRAGYSAVTTKDGKSTGTVDAIFTGDWVAGMGGAAILRSDLAGQGDSYLKLFAAGIDPSNQALLGALADTTESASSGFLAPSGAMDSGDDWTSASLDGRVDLTGQIDFIEGAEPELALELFLRNNTLQTGPLTLTDLQGELRLTAGALVGPRVTALLAQTPILLSDLRVALAEQARKDEVVMSAKLQAKDFPLDAEHMGAFLDKESLTALLEGFYLSGQIDLDDIDLKLAQASDGRYRMVLSGHAVPTGLKLIAGTPVEVHTAAVHVEELILEGGRARAWGQMADLAGSIGGRAITGGTLLFSYADQRLNIEDLNVSFAGGTLASLGGVEGHGGAALALDLSDRRHFAVAVELRDVEAKQLFAGAFGGSDDNSGQIDASLRFEAAPGALLEAQGGGFLRLRNARLWSIPVFRALFTQLGFDATAVFDSMSSGIAISGGRISFNSMRAHSPLLNLVGDGFLDMNSELGAKFEVRYSLVDKLGPLRELLYWLQNSLLTVEVKGDLYNPVVILRNSLIDLFTSDPKIHPVLPLPNLSKLPKRF
jgi:hypothetical protein